MENIVLSDEEIRLLCTIYSNTSQIQEGNLYSYQKETLKEIRAAKQYLLDKYEKNFLVTSYTPISKLNSVGELYFKEQDTLFECNIIKENPYLITDNYYGVLIEEKYDCALEELFQNKLQISSKIYTSFPSLKGKEINGKESVETLFSLRSKLNRTTYICMNADSSIIDKLQILLEDNGLYGAYHIFLAPDLLENISSKRTMKEEALSHPNVESYNFNLFHIH
ncbi:MAG: hypothetical protein Q4C49_13065 [Bacillota bacterium]|nr:hypothetical protein [Bacillota bacterium]